jgi:hypothetical protein
MRPSNLLTATARAERRAIRLLYAAAVLAPWFAGARPVFNVVWWVFPVLLTGAFVMLAANPVSFHGILRLPKSVLISVAVLLASLAFWALMPEPIFLTRFAAEQWAAVEKWSPGAFLNLSRAQKLALFASLLLGLLAAAQLGRREDFRRGLSLAIGWSAIGIALYSQAEDWIDLFPPDWAVISGGDERFNAAFLHYSIMATALNIGWPLLLFPIWKVRNFESAMRVLAIGGLATFLAFVTIPFDRATSAMVIAVGLLLTGCGWGLFGQAGWVRRWMILAGLVALLGTIAIWQIGSVRSVERNFPEHWNGAKATLEESLERDAGWRAVARTRNDHLVASPAPVAQSAWIAAGRMIADHPLFGSGPDSWPKQLAVYSNDPQVNTFSLSMQYASHGVLQTAAEWGLLPLGAWLTLWGGAFYALTACPGRRGLPSPGLLLALLGVTLHSLVHFPLEVPAIQIWTALLLGLALAPRKARPTPRLRLPTRPPARSFAPEPTHS